MTGETTRPRPPRPARRRRWIRRLLLGVTALLVLIVLATWAFIKLQPTQAPLALPGTAAQAPVGQLDGTWSVSSGVAGFRVAETALGLSNDTVGRTTAVSGTLVPLGNQGPGRPRLPRLAGRPRAGGVPAHPAPAMTTGRRSRPPGPERRIPGATGRPRLERKEGL